MKNMLYCINLPFYVAKDNPKYKKLNYSLCYINNYKYTYDGPVSLVWILLLQK